MVGIYVTHGATFTLNGIPDGSYQVYITHGADWDSGARLFSRNCAFEQVDQPMAFTTSASEYTTWTISTAPVPGGTASVSGVDPGKFPH
jgi:hypothetical protein